MSQPIRVIDPRAVAFLLPGVWGVFHLGRLVLWNAQELAAGRGVVFHIPTLLVAVVMIALGIMILRQNPLWAQVDPQTRAVTCWRGILGRSEVVEASGEGVEAVVLRKDMRRRGRKKRLVTVLGLLRGGAVEELLVDVRHGELAKLAAPLADALEVEVQELPPNIA